jgi:hypothetical protein
MARTTGGRRPEPPPAPLRWELLSYGPSPSGRGPDLVDSSTRPAGRTLTGGPAQTRRLRSGAGPHSQHAPAPGAKRGLHAGHSSRVPISRATPPEGCKPIRQGRIPASAQSHSAAQQYPAGMRQAPPSRTAGAWLSAEDAGAERTPSSTQPSLLPWAWDRPLGEPNEQRAAPARPEPTRIRNEVTWRARRRRTYRCAAIVPGAPWRREPGISVDDA